MWVDFEHPANTGLIAYFAARPGWLLSDEPLSRDPATMPQPYLNLGTHPDIVERLWDQITVLLPEACPWVLYHRPVLVHPWNGVVFAFAQGVPTYALRLPEKERLEALAAGAKTEFTYTAENRQTKTLDLKAIGEEWVLGSWSEREARWCLAAYDYAASEGRR
jgi:hypothetical protein